MYFFPHFVTYFSFLFPSLSPQDRARDLRTNQIVALKKVRMEKEKDGIPITCLREIKILKEIDHPNIVRLLGVTVGRQLDAYVCQSGSYAMEI